MKNVGQSPVITILSNLLIDPYSICYTWTMKQLRRIVHLSDCTDPKRL
jgi:hypothetical protein